MTLQRRDGAWPWATGLVENVLGLGDRQSAADSDSNMPQRHGDMRLPNMVYSISYLTALLSTIVSGCRILLSTRCLLSCCTKTNGELSVGDVG